MTLEIRFAEERDTPYLARWLNDPKTLQWFPMINEAEIDDSVRIWTGSIRVQAGLTACIDHLPVGMANLYIQPYVKLKHQCLFSIIVDEAHRGQGVGRALLEALAKLAKEKHHIELLHLEVYDGNPARRLYERCGFEEYGRHPRFIKADEKYTDKILMQKRLS